MRRGSYLSRRIAEGVSAFAVPTMPAPTPDILAATVYSQQWAHESHSTVLGFKVLALNETDAVRHGLLRIEAFGYDSREWRLLSSSTPVPWASVETICGIVGYEAHEEAALRRRHYQDGASQ